MSINLADYARTAAQRGWGAGWPSCGGAVGNLAVVTADRSGTRITVHKRIARLVDLLIDTTEDRGYRLIPGQCGGYNCRPIGKTTAPSNHSWGLAVDLNWHRNPLRTPLTTDIPTWMVTLWNRYGFAWGGAYGDPMHFEAMGTPEQMNQMTADAVRELSTPKVLLDLDEHATEEALVTYRLPPTPVPGGTAADALPDGSWPPNEEVIATPGPVGGWRGRTLMHPVFGWRGGFVHEAWSGPSGRHYVDRYDPDNRTGGRHLPSFASQAWELPPGDKFLVIRYSAPHSGSVGVEPQR